MCFDVLLDLKMIREGKKEVTDLWGAYWEFVELFLGQSIDLLPPLFTLLTNV